MKNYQRNNKMNNIGRWIVCITIIILSATSYSQPQDGVGKRLNAIGQPIISAVDNLFAQHSEGTLSAVDVYKQSGGYDVFDITREHSQLQQSYQELESFIGQYSSSINEIPNAKNFSQSVINKYKQYQALITKGKTELASGVASENAVNQTINKASTAYIDKAASSNIATDLASLGYPDAMLSLGRFGNPFDSTYATVQCLSSLYESVEVKQNGKMLDVVFGDSGMFGIKPKYTMALTRVTGNVAQFVIQDLINNEVSGATKPQAKLHEFAALVRNCEKRNGIKLIN